MRTIKFRGKREDDGVWVYGSLIDDKYIVGNVIDWNEDYFNTEYWWKVIPETVGQFTGLYDKNGAEIYEGDIVIGENYLFPCYDNRKMTIYWDNRVGGFDMCIFNKDEIEIIGNIHDSVDECIEPTKLICKSCGRSIEFDIDNEYKPDTCYECGQKLIWKGGTYE